MARVYLETSFVSACVTDRSDPASLYRRQVSREWWSAQAGRHHCFVSAEVLAELSLAAPATAAAALDWVREVPMLAIDPEIEGIAAVLVREKVMPGPLRGDAVHVATACRHAMEYILTWNVRHLANTNKVRHLNKVCWRLGLVPPQIVTPDLLWEDDDGSAD